MNYGGVQASHTDACTPFCFPKNRNSHVRTSPCTIQKTYRAIRQGTGIPWPDSECGDGYWRYWNHCGGFRHWHYGMVVRRSGGADVAGARRFPGWLNCGTDHGRHPIRCFLDSTLDRIADWALLAGVVIFFILHADWWYDINRSSPDCISWIGIAAAMVSMMTSFVTSYARARAESVGFEVKTALQRVPTDWSSFWWAWRLPGSRTKGYGWPSPWYCLRFWDSLPYSNAFLRLVARWPSVIRRISCEPAA